MTRRRPTRGVLLGSAVLAAVLGLVGCVPGSGSGSSAGPDAGSETGSGSGSGEDPLPAGATALPTEAPPSQAEAIAALPSSTLSAPEILRLGDGVLPPTNRWFSSLALSEESLPVFPLPLSARVSSTEVAIGLPDVASTAAVITGAHVDRVVLDVPASSFIVGAWDELSVRVDHLDDAGTPLTSTLLTEGSPFVVVTAARSVTLGLGPDLAPVAASDAAEVPDGLELATTAVATHTYAALLPAGSLDGDALTLEAGQVAVLWAAPDGTDPAGLVPAASHPVTDTRVTGAVDPGAGVATTTLTYETADGGASAVARLPHQGAADDCDLGTYASVLGPLSVCSGSTSTWTVPLREARTSLAGVDALGGEERAEIAAALAEDLAATPDVLPGDSYFGTKALYRLSMLASLADDLGEGDLRDDAVARLTAGIEPWLTGCGAESSSAGGERCFVHDEAWHGVVGQAPSFGSEEFNDHHFHYGYLLYAAAVLGELDPARVPEMAPTMEALAADVASPATTDQVPVRRVFDPYRGHSWASGPSPFADGNNQESSSEAVTAWAGLELWGRVSDRSDLATTGAWLLAGEATSALDYWMDPDLDQPGMEAFSHEIVAMNWGGKRDWATWFSPESSAMAGIQLLPMSPSQDYLADSDATHVEAIVREAWDGSDTVPAPVPQFSDYLLAYRAMAGPEAAAQALEEARALPDDAIDGAFSRSALLARIMVAAQR
ncbi:1,3-beta-glucanase [Serinibacter arcticus]|uniref:glucan endo-1,3-beta-D-glucosidase n=1 Tax=Serinibacter arcticus TaxID=1655435 RepID=A0A2U1ZRH3_9MICO|nr:glycosyl hydrolase [Serinibacter arcticus]PWD49578.1 1,3-beta-glucanase [Serinibacter arcticus]